mmetsp:Transcript_9216/g.22305  ORF Transcript_9216/g.22305 Transcript_9216/m.22305 type:complete len:308 (-) Transcript_9216:41-964(-)
MGRMLASLRQGHALRTTQECIWVARGGSADLHCFPFPAPVVSDCINSQLLINLRYWGVHRNSLSCEVVHGHVHYDGRMDCREVAVTHRGIGEALPRDGICSEAVGQVLVTADGESWALRADVGSNSSRPACGCVESAFDRSMGDKNVHGNLRKPLHRLRKGGVLETSAKGGLEGTILGRCRVLHAHRGAVDAHSQYLHRLILEVEDAALFLVSAKSVLQDRANLICAQISKNAVVVATDKHHILARESMKPLANIAHTLNCASSTVRRSQPSILDANITAVYEDVAGGNSCRKLVMETVSVADDDDA